MRRAPNVLRIIFLLAVVVAVAAIPETARAEDPVAKVTALNRKALDAYNAQDYDTARSLLKQALEICATSGLDQHPIKARTHVHFGIVAIVGYKQREVGIKQFKKALEIEPDIQLTKSLATPELQEAFSEASGGAGEAGDAAGGAGRAGGEPGAAGEDGNPSAQADDTGDEERPSAPRRKAPPRKKKSDEEEEDEGGGQTGSFFLALTLGSGFGLASGDAELNPSVHKLTSPGFAVAQLGHIEPEVGYFMSKDMLLSVAARIQYVSGVNGQTGSGCGADGFCSPGKTAFAAFARANWLLGDGPFRFTVGGQIGGGNIRHVVEFPHYTNCGSGPPPAPQNQTCVDSLASGPFLVGPMAGFFYELGDSVNLIVNMNTALGVPKFTFNFDVNAGIGFRL
jgi:hypothetical protein